MTILNQNSLDRKDINSIFCTNYNDILIIINTIYEFILRIHSLYEISKHHSHFYSRKK